MIPVRVLLLLCVAFPTLSVAAELQGEPKTKIERFVAQDGAVIVRGFSQPGKMNANYSGIIVVSAQEFLNASNGRRELGITIEVKESGRIERSNTSYVDYDEIDSLLKGIDYIEKIDKSATKLDEVQADYRTKGNLSVSVFSDRDGLSASVSSGVIGRTSAFFWLKDMGIFRKLIVDAKARLDSIGASIK